MIRNTLLLTLPMFPAHKYASKFVICIKDAIKEMGKLRSHLWSTYNPRESIRRLPPSSVESPSMKEKIQRGKKRTESLPGWTKGVYERDRSGDRTSRFIGSNPKKLLNEQPFRPGVVLSDQTSRKFEYPSPLPSSTFSSMCGFFAFFPRYMLATGRDVGNTWRRFSTPRRHRRQHRSRVNEWPHTFLINADGLYCSQLPTFRRSSALKCTWWWSLKSLDGFSNAVKDRLARVYCQ